MKRIHFSSYCIYALVIMLCITLFTGCDNNNSKAFESKAIQELRAYESQVKNTGKVDKLDISNIINNLNINTESLKIQVYDSQNKKYTHYDYGNIPSNLQLNSGDTLQLGIKNTEINVVEKTIIRIG